MRLVVALSRRRAVLAGALAGMAFVMMIAAPAASAHAVLQSSSPSGGALVPSGKQVRLVQLTFDEPVEASLGAIQVIAGDGNRVDTATVTHPGGSGNQVSVGLRGSLQQGSYLVLWRVVSADSHPVHGSFTFAIGHPGAVATTTGVSSPSSVAVVLGAFRFAGYTGLLLLVGLACFLILCQPALWLRPAARRLWTLGLAVTAAATALGFALQAALDIGGGWGQAVNPTTLQALAATRLGHAHLLRLALLAVLWLALRTLSVFGRAARVGVTLGVLALIGTVAAEGHAGRTLLTAAIDAVHLLAAGAWLGGLTVLLLLVLPEHRGGRATAVPSRAVPLSPRSGGAPSPADPLGLAVLERSEVEPVSWAPVRRFSTVAVGSVALLVMTGVIQSLRQVPEWGALTATDYGKLLLIKVGLVAATLAVAAVSTSVLHDRLGHVQPARRARILTWTVTAETALLVVVLAVTSALVATTPAAAAYRPAQERTVHAGSLTVDISAVAPAARTLDLHLYSYGADGTLADVQKITAEATAPARDAGLGPISVPLLQAGTGHFIASRLLLPRTGTWTLTLVVQVSEFDAYTTTTSLVVR
jgi:copper transport protein